MSELYDSQLRELCVALGWQGGTYHQVLAEVKKLAAIKRGLDYAISCDLLPARVGEIIGEKIVEEDNRCQGCGRRFYWDEDGYYRNHQPYHKACAEKLDAEPPSGELKG